MDDRGEGYDEVDATGWTAGSSVARSPPYQTHQKYFTKATSSAIRVDDVSSGALRYNMNHPKRGMALIISNRDFMGNLADRHGTEVDARRMESTLIGLGFDVDTFTNKTTDEIQACLMAKATSDHSDRDCFLCVIMTHGNEDHVLGTDQNKLHIKTLISFFGGQRCPSLAGKPKIFIINACQGVKKDEGHDVADAECFQTSSYDDMVEDIYIQNLPYELDFLYIHSTVHGYFSFRHTKEGTYFIRTLCDVIDQYGEHLEICKLLTLVSRRMAVGFKSRTANPDYDAKKQCPCFLSLLTKQLYFTRYPTKPTK